MTDLRRRLGLTVIIVALAAIPNRTWAPLVFVVGSAALMWIYVHNLAGKKKPPSKDGKK